MLACAIPTWAAAQAVASDAASQRNAQPLQVWVLQRLARPTPMRTAFVEIRGSALLKSPLRIAGEYARPDADTLVREVRTPYAETTTIRGGEATLARAGRKPRTFSLSRVPELAGLQASFGALLSGDAQTLQDAYRIDARGTRQAWSMALVPKDARFAAKIRDITLHGRGAELRCIETRPVKGDLQRTLLAGAARAADGVDAAEALRVLCVGDTRG